MRLTVPNPLGPPISFDTAHLPPLPVSSRIPTTHLRRTPLRIGIAVFVLILLLAWRPSPPFPPNYSDERRVERNLPWLSRNMAFPEGRDGRYLKFDSPKATGFNHQLQKMLLQHHLAVLSNRSFVYEPLVQDETGLPFVFSRPPWRSARVPLSALISTVISGFEKSYDVPRAVPDDYFRTVCPPMRQKVYYLKDEDHPNGNLEIHRDGQKRIHQLQALFAGTDEKCLRIEGQIFDNEFFDSPSLLEIYETFSQSPVLAHFTFSPTVLSVINRAMPELAPESSPYDIDRLMRMVTKEPARPGSSWKHILTLHLRTGPEWEQACHDKGVATTPFAGFCKLPGFPGNENVPPPAEMTEAARMGLYKAKCLPEVLDIIARARRMRKNHPFLRTVYILTDGVSKWAEEVRMWLLSEGWEHVWIGQRDVWPNWQDREVGLGVDMEVARRSGVFVGNGFSTTSSTIALLRARDGLHPDLTQFW